MLDMIERLLLEADLEDQLPKLEVGIQNAWLFDHGSLETMQIIKLFVPIHHPGNIKQCIFPNMKMFCDKVYGKTIDGIKDLLRFLLSEPSTGRALKRQVAFLFFFLPFLLFQFLYSVF